MARLEFSEEDYPTAIKVGAVMDALVAAAHKSMSKEGAKLLLQVVHAGIAQELGLVCANHFLESQDLEDETVKGGEA